MSIMPNHTSHLVGGKVVCETAVCATLKCKMFTVQTNCWGQKNKNKLTNKTNRLAAL